MIFAIAVAVLIGWFFQGLFDFDPKPWFLLASILAAALIFGGL